MANDFLDDLSAKELSAEETRQVLRRLAQDEFAVTDHATVADLAELTGVRTESIGRILAELRGKNWAEWRESVDAKLLKLQQRKTRQVSVAACVTASVCLVVAFVGMSRSGGGGMRTSNWSYTVTSGSYTFGFDEGCTWSEADMLGNPGPIVHEDDANLAKRQARLYRRSNCF